MNHRHSAAFARALRAAAATTGLVLAGAGCSGGSKGAPASAPSSSGGDTPDAAVAAERTCDEDPGYSSVCCTEERAAGRSPVACTPWGPPAPPAYSGERLA